MALQSKQELQNQLNQSAKRLQAVRERKEQERVKQIGEDTTAVRPSPVDIVKP